MCLALCASIQNSSPINSETILSHTRCPCGVYNSCCTHLFQVQWWNVLGTWKKLLSTQATVFLHCILFWLTSNKAVTAYRSPLLDYLCIHVKQFFHRSMLIMFSQHQSCVSCILRCVEWMKAIKTTFLFYIWPKGREVFSALTKTCA